MASNHPIGIRIAIVGGGIGGLFSAFAIGSRRPDALIDVYEAADAFSEVGAGLGLRDRPWEIIDRLGLKEEFLKIQRPMGATFQFRKSDQVQSEVLGEMPDNMRHFHRQDLHRVILEAAQRHSNCTFHVGHRLERYDESEYGVNLFFKNGATANCELLIGADGLKSVVRGQLQPGKKPVFTGRIAYRGLIPAADIHPGHPCHERGIVWMGKYRHLITYPISDAQFINFIAYIHTPVHGAKYDGMPHVQAVSQEKLIVDFQGFSEDVQIMLSKLTKPSLWSMNTGVPLDTYVSKRVVLIGDAAHPMTPHLGAGAAQAIEDSWVLSRCLQNIDNSQISQALALFDTDRREFTIDLMLQCDRQGEFYDLIDPISDAQIQAGDTKLPEGFAKEWLSRANLAHESSMGLGASGGQVHRLSGISAPLALSDSSTILSV